MSRMVRNLPEGFADKDVENITIKEKRIFPNLNLLRKFATLLTRHSNGKGGNRGTAAVLTA